MTLLVRRLDGPELPASELLSPGEAQRARSHLRPSRGPHGRPRGPGEPQGWGSPEVGGQRSSTSSALTLSALLGLVLTAEAKSCSFWRTSLGKFRLLRPSGQREGGGGFLDKDSEDRVTDAPPACTSWARTVHPHTSSPLAGCSSSPSSCCRVPPQKGRGAQHPPVFTCTPSPGSPGPLTEQWPRAIESG